MTSALFSPIKLADLQLANRIAVSPMCQYSANDGVADDWHMTHLGMLANSGASFLVVEATHVERHGRITHGCLGLYSDACEAALQRVVNHCHRIGKAKLAIQLAHAGRKASAQRPWEGGKALSEAEDPWPTIGPSALPFGSGCSGKTYKFVPYGVTKDSETIDYGGIATLAREHRPKMIVAGASAYARVIDFQRIAEIAQSVGALFFVDMAHIAGLVAAGVHPSPVPYARFRFHHDA